MMFDASKLSWINKPAVSSADDQEIIIRTDPHTDFWQRTYYGFRNDNGHALVMETEKDFTFTVKTSFISKNLYDQCGIIVYQDSENWMKASIEYENDKIQRLGSVVTNHGFSDWATTDIPSDVREMYYRLSRRRQDFYVETSRNGIHYEQLRMLHLIEGSGSVRFGIYACSPLESSFDAVFTKMELGNCTWPAYQP